MSLMPSSAMFRLRPASVVTLFAGIVFMIAVSLASADQKAAQKITTGEVEIQKRMSSMMEISFTDTSLADALEYFSGLTGQKFDVDEAALEKEGLADASINLEVSAISAGSTLKHLLYQHDLACVVQDEVLKVVPRKIAAKREFKIVPNKKVEDRVKSALKEKSEVDFTEIPLPDAVQFLRDLHNLNILLDERAMNAAKIDPASMVTIKMTGKSLDETLKALLAKVKLKYVVDHEVILIQPAAKEKTKR